MTEREKVKQDIKSGKLDIYELYEKYGLYEPYPISFEGYKEKYGNDKTLQNYNNDIENDKIEFLLMHMFPEEE